MRFAALQLAITAALLLTLWGLAARRRMGLSRTFPAYAAAVILLDGMVALWPSRFFNPEFWLLKQAVYDVCKLAVALELAHRVLRAFPGAQRTARRWSALLLAGSSILVALAPSRSYETMSDWQPRIWLGIVWLLTLTAIVMVWYRLPVHVWHRALLLGFSGYLLTFGVLVQAFRLPWAGLADGWAYLGLCCWWAWSAWRVESVPAVSPGLRRRLGMEVA